MPIFYTIIGIIALAIIVYLIILYLRGSSQIQNLAAQPFDLNTPKVVLDTDQTKSILLTNGGSTICAFVNYRIGDRTSPAVDPKAAGLIPLLAINGALNLMVSPTMTELQIYTKGLLAGSNIESVPLPPLPQQKWIFIAILRDGRRFDVMYNNRIVASHRTAFFPVIAHNGLTFGNSKLLGQAVNVLVAHYRLSPDQVLQQRAALADTNGQPVAVQSPGALGVSPLPFQGISVECLPGIPCKPVTKPPRNHLKAWSSPYQ